MQPSNFTRKKLLDPTIRHGFSEDAAQKASTLPRLPHCCLFERPRLTFVRSPASLNVPSDLFVADQFTTFRAGRHFFGFDSSACQNRHNKDPVPVLPIKKVLF